MRHNISDPAVILNHRPLSVPYHFEEGYGLAVGDGHYDAVGSGVIEITAHVQALMVKSG